MNTANFLNKSAQISIQNYAKSLLMTKSMWSRCNLWPLRNHSINQQLKRPLKAPNYHDIIPQEECI